MAYDFESGSTGQRLTGAIVNGITAFPFSIAAWVKPESYAASTGRAIASLFDVGRVGTGDGTVSQYDTNGNPRAEYQQDGFDTRRYTTLSSNPSTGAWHLIVAVFQGSSPYQRIYLDGGGTYADGTTAPGGFLSTSNNRGFIVGQTPGFFTAYDGEIAEVAIWDVALSATDVTTLASYYANSGQNSLPTPVSYWPLRTDTGYVSSGLEDAVGANDFSSANSATFNASNGPTLSAGASGVTATPSVGTVRVVGQTPTAGVTHSAAPSVGTLRFDGQTPTVGVTQSVAPLVGALRLDGQQPSVSYTDHVAVAPSVGTVRFIGQTPTVGYTQSAAPSTGTIVFVGQQPTLNATESVAPLVGVLRFDGQQPSVSFTDHQSVAPSAGTCRLDGQQPTVAYTESVAVTPSVGTVQFVGNAPTLAQGWPFDQALYPTAVSLTGLTGAYTDIYDDPSTPDGNWLMAA